MTILTSVTVVVEWQTGKEDKLVFYPSQIPELVSRFPELVTNSLVKSVKVFMKYHTTG